LSLSNSESNSDDYVKSRAKNKKALKKKEWKCIKEKNNIEEMDRLGYSYLQNEPKLWKYWKKRYLLFSQFDKGIKLDEGIFISLYMHILIK